MLVFELTGTLSSPNKISQTLVYKKLLIIYCNNNSYVKLFLDKARGSLNTVRVPIGWWILGYDINDPSNQQEYKTFAPGGIFNQNTINYIQMQLYIKNLTGLYYLDRQYNVAVLI